MIKIRKFKKEDTREVSKLIFRTYKKFCTKDATKAANEKYLAQYDIKTKSIKELEGEFMRTKIVYVAEVKNRIVGIVRGGEIRIGNLYVDEKYQRKGIARLLVDRFEKEAKKRKIKQLKITASLYSVQFYLSVGYKKTTGVRNHKGIMVQPMKKFLTF